MLAFLPLAIAITPPGISLDENDGSDVVCVVKRTGLIPTGGLTVQLELLSILNKPSPSMFHVMHVDRVITTGVLFTNYCSAW